MLTRRIERLSELIQQTVSKMILTLKDPQIGFVTITGATVTQDISLAKIFYSVLGTAEQKEATMAALDRARPHIRRELARLENLRKVPELLFVYDESVERADRVHRILETLEKERKTGDPE